MNIVKSLSSGILISTLLLAPAIASATQAVHEHAPAAQNQLTLDHGKRWATDAALRDGMTDIRAAMAAKLPAIHDNTLDDAGYAALVAELETALTGIFKNCRLPPAADMQLHHILLPMNAAIQDMKQAKTAAQRHDAAVAILGGLADYGRYFDHPGWQPL